MLRWANDTGDFEGYILLMGLVLAGHGMAGILYTFGRRRPSPTRDR